MTRRVEPADVVRLSDLLIERVRSAPGRDWSVRAGSLEWDVERTVEHLAASLGKYALYLASRATRFVPLALTRPTAAGEMAPETWLSGLASCAAAFRAVAEAAPAGARAFHAAGMADAEGYAALACAHVMEHGHDVAEGLGAGFEPPPELCAAVTLRLFPWTPPDDATWTTFLWIVGRATLPDRAPADPRTLPVLAPLAEWDGAIPLQPDFPVAAHVLDPATRRWRPVAT